MKKTKLIQSAQNPRVKQLQRLRGKSRERKKTGLFIIEGQRELAIALSAGYTVKTLFFCPDILPNINVIPVPKAVEIIALSFMVYEKVAYRTTTEGVLAIVQSKTHNLDALSFSTHSPLILVAEAPEKPGNIGALLRTADAAALDAVLIANPKSDLYHPNLIRASVGTVFTTPIGVGTTTEVIQFLKKRQIAMYGAALTASQSYVAADFTGATALVVGTEATGLSAAWLHHTDQNIVIPMQGYIDSLNVSVAAAVLVFEAKRQRGF